ncbi:MAG: hypothetical protein PUB21_12430 [Bacteroidales bacterium]|nr:hypothetical protein [Bacteroidales bacterium]
MKYNRRSFIKLGGITAVSLPLVGFTACKTTKENIQNKTEISPNKELKNIAGLYNLNHIPFSSPGSYLKISGRCASGKGRIMISTVRKIPYIDFATQDSPFDYYEIALFKDGKEISYAAGSNSSYVSLEGKGATARISIREQETFVFDVRGGDLVFLPVHSCAAIQEINPSFYLLNDYRGMCFHQIRAGEGTNLKATASSTVSGTTGPYHDIPYTFTFSGETTASGAYALTVRD